MDSSGRLVFNKETTGSVQSDAADRPTDFQIDNTHVYTAEQAQPGRLHHSYFNNGFHWVLLLTVV